MNEISVISLDLTGRDLSKLTASHRPLLVTPADNLPLAVSVEVLADIVRRVVDQPLAFRIPDDARLLAVWQQAGTSAIVSTYWRHKLAHVDLLITANSLPHALIGRLSLMEAQLTVLDDQPHPLLVRCKVRNRVPAIAEVLGLVAYMPAMQALATRLNLRD